MALPAKNHSTLQTDWPVVVSEEVSGSSLEVAVLHTTSNETLGELKMPAELFYDRATIALKAPELQTAGPVVVPGQPSSPSLEIVVIHTQPKETLGALKIAAELASGLAHVRLLAVQVVPYP